MLTMYQELFAKHSQIQLSTVDEWFEIGRLEGQQHKHPEYHLNQDQEIIGIIHKADCGVYGDIHEEHVEQLVVETDYLLLAQVFLIQHEDFAISVGSVLYRILVMEKPLIHPIQ